MAFPFRGDGTPVYTKCLILNHAGDEKAQYLTLDGEQDWHRLGAPPKAIQNQCPGEFYHVADAKGSVGGVAYLLNKDKLKWIIAWSNQEQQNNKVYTEIIAADSKVDWEEIKNRLDAPTTTKKSYDHNKFGYSADVEIEGTSDTPKLTATLTKAN